MKKIKVIAIIGKSGSGKDSILSAFRNENNDNYHILVPFTTRPQREKEEQHREYHFIDNTDVARYLDKPGDKIAQCTSFNNWIYGFFYDEFKEDKINIGIFTPTAIFQLMESPWGKNNLEISTIYIYAKDKDRLLRQLNREENPDIKEIIRRFNEDATDFCSKILMDLPNLFLIENNNQDKLIDVIAQVKDIVKFIMGEIN